METQSFQFLQEATTVSAFVVKTVAGVFSYRWKTKDGVESDRIYSIFGVLLRSVSLYQPQVRHYRYCIKMYAKS